MDTNFLETTEYTDYTESLAAGLKSSYGLCLYIMTSEC